jgi:hypothetical protein
MRDDFWAWYPPTTEQFTSFSTEALVALDANVLLAPYRLRSTSRDALLGILETLGDRIFVPYQAALEYQRNRIAVVAEQLDVLSSLAHVIDEQRAELSKALDPKRRIIERHPNLDLATVSLWLDECFDTLTGRFLSAANGLTTKQEAVEAADAIHSRLTTLAAGRVGIALGDADREKLLEEGLERYKKGVPPGFADKSKKDDRQYGDLIIWKELIAKSKAAAIPVVFITDDQKEDWLRKSGGLRVGPLPALREEFRSESDGQDFWLYSLEQFLRVSERFTTNAVDETVINEVAEHISGDPAAEVEQALRDELATREAIIGSLHASLLALTEDAEEPTDALTQIRARLDREVDRAAEIRATLRVRTL